MATEQELHDEAGKLASFLAEEGHPDPMVLILPPTPPHSDIPEWARGCLQVWSESDCFVPLFWKDIPVLSVQKNIHDYAIEECDDDDDDSEFGLGSDWWKNGAC